MLVSALLTTLASSVLIPSTAAAIVPQQLQVHGTNYCLDVRDGVSEVGAVVQIWECYGGLHQSWAIEYPTRVLDPGDVLGESQFSRIRYAGSTVTSKLCLGFQTKGEWTLADKRGGS